MLIPNEKNTLDEVENWLREHPEGGVTMTPRMDQTFAQNLH